MAYGYTAGRNDATIAECERSRLDMPDACVDDIDFSDTERGEMADMAARLVRATLVSGRREDHKQEAYDALYKACIRLEDALVGFEDAFKGDYPVTKRKAS